MAKKNARVVVNAVYFELLVRKAELLDDLTCDGGFTVREGSFKTYNQIDKAWVKAEADYIAGTEPYVEPKAQKAKK